MTVQNNWDALKKHPISARDFYTPLLVTLGELTGYRPHKAIDAREVYAPLCSRMGITLEQFGKPDKVNAFWVERWIQEAFKALIGRGLGIRAARGSWALSPDGAAKAQELRQQSGEPPLPVRDEPPVVPVAVPPQEQVGYHPDPYIRSLGLQTCACAGAWSAQSSICQACPLETPCIGIQAVELSQLKRVLAQEDAAPKGGTPPPEPPPPPGPKGSKQPPRTPAVPGVGHPGEAISTTAQQASDCPLCGQTIPRGADIKWVRTPSGGGGRPGIYHPDCYDEIVATISKPATMTLATGPNRLSDSLVDGRGLTK